mmetsp:Transcript_14407/g.24553  ORF Transcript_14407/g.24553 Transcript_14407/m.24553 type:complete len:130 (+) Transcript_14407:41-430(+)
MMVGGGVRAPARPPNRQQSSVGFVVEGLQGEKKDKMSNMIARNKMRDYPLNGGEGDQRSDHELYLQPHTEAYHMRQIFKSIGGEIETMPPERREQISSPRYGKGPPVQQSANKDTYHDINQRLLGEVEG